MKAVTDSSFQSEVLDSQLPVLVDFWADWCGPCKALSPVLERMAPSYDGRVSFVKADIGEAMQAAARHMVRSIPTLIIFKGGAPAATLVGSRPQAEMDRWISAVLAA